MSKFHSRYHVEKDAAENGNWIPLGDGVSINARRFNSTHSQAARRRLETEYAHRKVDGEFPSDVSEEILERQLAESVIVSWKGVDDENGNPVLPTAEGILAIFKKYPDFRDEVAGKIVDRTSFKKVVREADLKN